MSRSFGLVYGFALVGVGFALGAWMLAPEERVRAFGEAIDGWLTPASASDDSQDAAGQKYSRSFFPNTEQLAKALLEKPADGFMS